MFKKQDFKPKMINHVGSNNICTLAEKIAQYIHEKAEKEAEIIAEQKL